MTSPSSRTPRVPLLGATLACVFYIGSIPLVDRAAGGQWFWDFWIYNAILVVAGITLMVKGLTDRTVRTPALCISAAILLWGAGNVA